MASRVIYPPIVDPYLPAFNAETRDSVCRIPFKLSKFNSVVDIKSVHVSIVKQNTGKSVVNTEDSDGRYRASGIIINVPFQQDKDSGEDNLFYIELNGHDIDIGWTVGWIYKIQIRFCSADNYNPATGGGQSAWLNANASNFSEWSTVCVVKAIGNVDYEIPRLGINTKTSDMSNLAEDSSVSIYSLSLEVFGHFFEDIRDTSELIHSYEFMLYDNDFNLLEDSYPILANQYQDNRSFNYLFKTELEDGLSYKVGFKFETINHYIGGFYDMGNLITVTTNQPSIERIDCQIITAETDDIGLLTDITSVHEEEEEGRIGIKLYSPLNNVFSGNICIRRADSRTNFKKWDDIKIFVLKEDFINSLDIFYDYTVESGVWYRYAVQKIDGIGNRGIANFSSAVMRNFNYSFLLGSNNQQLKLEFDNTMSNFKYQIMDSKTDTIGGVFPTISRNAATHYRTFPINGLISFWMDENKLFCDKKDVYNYKAIVDLYEDYNTKNSIMQYDYIYERDFRQKVLDFLQDGEVKLFKSPTEGNILVRLTDVNCAPNQSLDRMIYSFSSTAYEIAEPTMENYSKYNLYEVGEWSSDFSVYDIHLGQLLINIPVGGDLISEIYKKYDKSKYNIGGYRESLKSISNLKLRFEGDPLRIRNAGGFLLGNKFIYNNSPFVLTERDREYVFDDRITFMPFVDRIIIQGDDEGVETSIPVMANFIYETSRDVYQEKKVQTRVSKRGVGQIFESCTPGTDFYKELYYKYYIDWPNYYKRLQSITAVEIEANPGVLIGIKDSTDEEIQVHEINATGQLILKDLNDIVGIIYLGVRDSSKPDNIDNTVNSDVMINYYYALVYGSYKEEV